MRDVAPESPAGRGRQAKLGCDGHERHIWGNHRGVAVAAVGALRLEFCPCAQRRRRRGKGGWHARGGCDGALWPCAAAPRTTAPHPDPTHFALTLSRRVPHRAQRRGVARLLHLQHGQPRQLDEPTGRVRSGQDRPRRRLLPPIENLARSQPARQGAPPASHSPSFPPLHWSSHPGLSPASTNPPSHHSSLALCPLPTPHSLPLAIDRTTWST